MTTTGESARHHVPYRLRYASLKQAVALPIHRASKNDAPPSIPMLIGRDDLHLGCQWLWQSTRLGASVNAQAGGERLAGLGRYLTQLQDDSGIGAMAVRSRSQKY